MDESSPQTTANTVRLWCTKKPTVVKNTDRIKANAVGFYAVNGTSAISFPERSKIADICGFLDTVRISNGDRSVIAVLDNFSAHRSASTISYAESLGIRLVFLPPYSPDLNPIEFVWRKMKRVISKNRITDRSHMTALLEERFYQEVSKTSYFAYWKDLFLSTVCLNN
jgi:transposase